MSGDNSVHGSKTRVGVVGLTLTLAAVLTNPLGLMMGGALASGLALHDVITVLIIGCLTLAIIFMFQGSIGARNRVPTYMCAVSAFGNLGSKAIILLPAFLQASWTSFLFEITSSAFIHVSGYSITDLDPLWRYVTFFIIGISFAFFSADYRIVERVSKISMPVVLILSAWGFYQAVNVFGWVGVWEANPLKPISLFEGVGLVVASATVASTVSPDYFRFAKNMKTVVFSCFGGFLTTSMFIGVIGAVLTIVGKTWDLTLALESLGMPLLAYFLLILSCVPVALLTLYTASVTFGAVFKLSPLRAALLAGLVGTVLACAGMVSRLIEWLGFLGIVVPPIIGVMVADHWILKRSYDPDNPRGVNPAGFAACLIGSIVGFVAPGVWILNALLAGLASYLAFSKLVDLYRGHL